MLSLWYHSLYVLVPLGTPGTKLSVPVSLSAPQYSAGTTCWVFGTTHSMCWYPSVPLVPSSLCQWVSLHPSTLLVPHVESLVPLALCVGTPRYPWYRTMFASESLCTLVFYWYHTMSLWYHWLYVLVPLGNPGTTLCQWVSLHPGSAPQYSAGTTRWVFGTTDSVLVPLGTLVMQMKSNSNWPISKQLTISSRWLQACQVTSTCLMGQRQWQWACRGLMNTCRPDYIKTIVHTDWSTLIDPRDRWSKKAEM